LRTATSRRYGPKLQDRPIDVTVGGAWSWRARFVAKWGVASPWTEYDTFGVTQAGSLPTCSLVPLPVLIWDSPLSQWTWRDVDDGHVQDAFRVQIATDAAFTSIVDDSGDVVSAALSYQHGALAAGTYYRRAKVRTNAIDWSAWDYDSFVLAAKTSQSQLVLLSLRHRDGIESRIYAPISSPRAVRQYGGTGGFEFVINNYYPWTERALVSCHHFQELSGAVGHDWFGENHLTLAGSPAWTDGVLNLAGDDYGQSADLTFVLDADWSAYLAVLPSGASGCLWFLGGYADDANYYSVQFNGAGKVRVVHAGGASADLTVAAASWVVLRIKRSGTTVTLSRLDTGASVTATVTATGTARLAIGRYAGATPGSIAAGAKVAGHLLYSDDVTAAEDTINLAAYRSNLVHRSLQVL
jgi:hypothetical protein